MKEFRTAEEPDLVIVASWIANAEECRLWAGWRVSFPVDLQTLPLAIAFSEAMSFVLDEDEGIAAFGQIIPKQKRRGHLARLIVRPELRGKGNGNALVRELVAVSRHSFSTISLNVADSNAVAIRLYSKFGFKRSQRPPGEPESPETIYMEIRFD